MRVRLSSSRNVQLLIRAALMCSLLFLLAGGMAHAQQIPDVQCKVEDYQLSPGSKVQVAVLRDPAGEQVARFDLTHGANLVSLRYEGRELLYGHGAGAHVEMYKVRHGTEEALKGLSPYWSSFHPDQAGSSMGVPATVAGVACQGERSLRAFAMMIDAGVDSSFRRHPLMGVWKGRLSGHFPPGYSTPYTIETDASWVANSGKTPKYYLRLDQTLVNIRAADSGTMQWLLLGTVPWNFDYRTGDPDTCTSKSPCQSSTTPAIAAGRYEDAAHTKGVAVVVPTGIWSTNKLYLGGSINAYGGSPVVRKRSFGAVLMHALAGMTGFHFQWYICAGSWDQARAFATKLRH